MRSIKVLPCDFPCRFVECPPGLFYFQDDLYFKSEYGEYDGYCVSSGEKFWGGTKTIGALCELIVTPCTYEIEDDQ